MQKNKLLVFASICLIFGAGITFAAQKLLPDRVYLADKAYTEVQQDLSFIRGNILSLENQEAVLEKREQEKFCTLVAIKIADDVNIKSQDTMPRYQAECLGLYKVQQ